MTRRHIRATAILFPLLLAACETETAQPVRAADEVARLTSMGYRVTAQTDAGNTTVLRYSGPINASVACAQGRGTPRPISSRNVTASGTVEDFELNSYLVLSAGADGVISANERDGLYVVTRLTRPAANADATDIETIAFEPGDRGTFRLGYSCRGA